MKERQHPGAAHELRVVDAKREARRAHCHDQFAGEIAQLLLKLPDYGVGVAVSADKEMDLKPGYAQYVEARAEIVAGDDCGLNLRGRKNYRVLLRPGLSRCGER